MNRNKRLLSQLIILVFLLASFVYTDKAFCSPHGLSVHSSTKISSIQVRLFYESIGQIDARDLVSKEMVLWNTIIGEGDASSPSNASIVFVEITGPLLEGILNLTIKNDKTIIRQEKVNIAEFFSQTGKITVPFVAIGTGCGLLKIDAVLKVGNQIDEESRKVDFKCGE